MSIFDLGLASSSHLYLAQVAFQFNLASVTGIVLAVGGAALYAVRSLRPQLSRDHDIFFSAVGLLCGLILIFYGWRFDPIMQFGQVLLSGSAIFFVVENLRLRQISTEQAKRNPAPIVDDERPVSIRYKADFDDRDMFEERSGRQRIRSSRETRSRDEYDDRPVRRSTRSEPRLAPADRSRPKRRPSDDPLVDDVNDTSEGWGSGSSRSRTTPPRGSSNRPRRRPAENVNRPRSDESENYVDYRPIEPDENERDNWSE